MTRYEWVGYWVTIQLVCHVQYTFVRIASTTETCPDNKLICHVQCTFVHIASTTEICLDNKLVCNDNVHLYALRASTTET